MQCNATLFSNDNNQVKQLAAATDAAILDACIDFTQANISKEEEPATPSGRNKQSKLSNKNLVFGKKQSIFTSCMHIDEQRRRLEHFLSVAKQAKSHSDSRKIKELLDELNESNKSLS